MVDDAIANDRALLGLAGKIAIVWGGGQAMGESSATYLARAGCDVAIVDLDPGRGETVAETIRSMGRRACALQADVRDERQVEQAVRTATERLGPLDVSVTVVGGGLFKTLMDVTDAEWDQQQAINLKSVLYINRAVARDMMKAGRPGSLISICSVSGTTSGPYHAAYGAAKAAMANLVKSMAVEWGPNIRVNAVAPGTIRTVRLPRMAHEGSATDPFRIRLPMQRRGTSDEIGSAVLFLASELASYVTGTTLLVDGGWSAAWLFDYKTEDIGARPAAS